MKKILIVILLCVVVYAVSYYILRDSDQKRATIGTSFSTSIKGLADSVSTPIVSLNNDDTYTLDARIVKKKISGQYVKMLAYNGSVPGPEIHVAQGSTVHIKLVNHTDIPTTLHSHGVRIDNAYDGVPGSTQPVIPVGKTFTYTVKFDDSGVFWYHPHFREDYTQESGLYGNYIVAPRNDKYFEQVNRTVALFIDDILLDSQGRIAMFDRGDVTHTLMGRYGNTMLVNGSTEYAGDVNVGDVVRYYFTNSSNTRVFRVAIPGAKMKLIGTDIGAYEREEYVDSVTIGPAERAIVDVLYGKPGTYHLQHISPLASHELGKIRVGNSLSQESYVSEFAQLHANQDVVDSIAKYRGMFDKAVDKSLRISIDMKHMGAGSGGHMHMMQGGSMMSDMNMDMGTGNQSIEWEDGSSMMNDSSTNKSIIWKLIDESTGATNMDIDWSFKKNDVIKLKIYNDPHSMHPMQHPFHVHGQRFLVLTRDGVANQNLAWKDTVLIEKGQTVELLVDMSNPGRWMAHCHIPEHLESGMMLNFNVN